MKRQIVYFISAVIIMICFASTAYCNMSSNNYSIPTSVLSGGGISMSSANYIVESTLGQPTPIMELGGFPTSSNYVLYPGFWYTLAFFKDKNRAMPWIPLLLLDELFGRNAKCWLLLILTAKMPEILS